MERRKVTSAKCIDYFDPDILEKIESLDRDKPVLLYCATGGRSSEIAELLKEYGFKKFITSEAATKIY
jgi:rhodanese-related sulfurtransferase